MSAYSMQITAGVPSTLPKGAPPVRHYLQFADFSADETHYLLERTATIKHKFKTFDATTRW